MSVFCCYIFNENPRRKYFLVRGKTSNQTHIAKRLKTGFFKSLCGLRFPFISTSGSQIENYRGMECRRCQKATSHLIYERGIGWAREIRLGEEGSAQC